MLTRRLTSTFAAIGMMLSAAIAVTANAQSITTAAIDGRVTDSNGTPRPGARVVAVHQPSGTRYEARTRSDGRFSVPGLRVGGPYTVTTSSIGLEPQVKDNVFLTLGVANNLEFVMREVATQLGEVTVTAEGDRIFSSTRTGASTSISREALATLPTISGRLESVARLTPQSGGGMSFAGQDSRLNNVTIDGSYFNNSFGLASSPGDRTNVAPISLSAIEQVQINIAPYDVRQGNFVGAAINSVTRSGTNELRGSIYYQRRDESLVGKDAGDLKFNPGTFNYGNIGGWVAGPLLPNRLFFFVNYENEAETAPGTTFRANTGSETVAGSITRVRASDLDALSSFLSSKFNYETGPYQGYDFERPATRFLGKLDLNLSDRNKLSLRYNRLDSQSDNLVSNSSSLGFGTRRTNTTGLNFRNSNYQQLENIRSVVGELNSIVGDNMANNLLVGYTTQDESRGNTDGELFPFVDILDANAVYTSFGFEPFTPNNALKYNTFQVQDNFTRYFGRHDVTLGVSAERFRSQNVFNSGAQSVYTYNSLADFYADANGFLANPNRTTSPVSLRRFQVRYNNIPGQDKPLQPLEVLFAGIYAQDEWRATNKLKLTLGLRVDAPYFEETAFVNPQVDGMSFRDEDGNVAKFSTSKLPDPKYLLSPRVGFNWDARGDRSTQIRGGSGVFTGRPAYVWISNQIGENGILTGSDFIQNTFDRPFNPDPNRYKPTNVTGAPAATYGLAFTDPDFRFPQLWKTNIGIDQRLPLGLVGTAEFVYGRDVNGVYYINANLPAANTTFSGADARPRYSADVCPASGVQIRLNCAITSAIVLKNQTVGRSWNIAGSLEKPFGLGSFFKAAYSYGEAKNTVDAGSIGFGSWNNNPHSGDPNNPGLAFSTNSPGHRAFAAASLRKEYFRFGATTASIFMEARTIGNASYTFTGDLNGDGGTSNDLIYIHRDVSEMNFQQYTTGSGATLKTFTAQQQADAWNALIEQDDYLRENRGQYAERGGKFLPLVKRADVSVAQEVFTDIVGRRNSLQIRADILNFGNFLNKNWGLGQRLVNFGQPLDARGADTQGRATYRLRTVNNELMTRTLEQTSGFGDVFSIQLGVRYSFN